MQHRLFRAAATGRRFQKDMLKGLLPPMRDNESAWETIRSAAQSPDVRPDLACRVNPAPFTHPLRVRFFTEGTSCDSDRKNLIQPLIKALSRYSGAVRFNHGCAFVRSYRCCPCGCKALRCR